MGEQPLPAGTHVRPTVSAALAVDTVVFDMDGVLIDVRGSFREAVRRTVAAVQRAHHRQDVWTPSFDDIAAFKQAGGFNDDIDLSVALARLALRGEGGAAQRVALALERFGGGLAGLAEAAPGLPELDHIEVLRHFDQLYWGAEGYERQFGEPADLVGPGPGLAEAERPLVSPDLLPRLAELGVAHVGIITGRTPVELRSALERLGWSTSDLAAMVTGDVIRKPDPGCLDLVVGAVEARALVFVGDTRDDWELVRRYRDERPDGAEVRGVMVAAGTEAVTYRQLGVDAMVKRTEDVLVLIQRWREAAAPRRGFLRGLRRG